MRCSFFVSTLANVEISVFSKFENGSSANSHSSSKKIRSCGLCWSQASGSCRSQQHDPTCPGQIDQVREHQPAVLLKSNLFSLNHLRLLAARAVGHDTGKGDSLELLQIVCGEDRTFLPEKRPLASSMNLAYNCVELLTVKLNQSPKPLFDEPK